MPHSNLLAAPTLAAVALIALGGLLIAGCASTNIQAQWTDPQFADHSLRGARVLVVCGANETAIKRICQDQLSAQVAASGATPVTGPESATLTAGAASDDGLLAAARAAGAKAILASTIAPDATVVSPGPTVGFGIGGFGGSGGWHGGTDVGASVGVTVPVGGGRVNTAYAASMVLTDVASGRLMWTSKVTAPVSQDVGAQIGALAKTGVGAARKAGLF